MSFEDKLLNCLNCQREFVFTAGEQEFCVLKELRLAHVRRVCSDDGKRRHTRS
jgi:hypothetical protein